MMMMVVVMVVVMTHRRQNIATLQRVKASYSTVAVVVHISRRQRCVCYTMHAITIIEPSINCGSRASVNGIFHALIQYCF